MSKRHSIDVETEFDYLDVPGVGMFELRESGCITMACWHCFGDGCLTQCWEGFGPGELRAIADAMEAKAKEVTQ